MSFFSSSTENNTKRSEQSERIARITQKLNLINLANASNRPRKSNEPETKIHNIEFKLTECSKAYEAKISSAKETLLSLERRMGETKEQNNRIHNQRIEEIHGIETQLNEMLDEEKEIREETERHLMRIIEDKASCLQEELKKMNCTGAGSLKSIKQYLDGVIPDLYSSIEQECSERKQSQESIQQKLSEDIQVIHIKLEQETKTKQREQQMVYDLFSDIVNSIKQEFQNEKEETRKGEEKLLLLFKETTNRIEMDTSQHDVYQ